MKRDEWERLAVQAVIIIGSLVLGWLKTKAKK